MRYKDFKITKIVNPSSVWSKTIFAEVTEKVGYFFSKKEVTRGVFKTGISSYWRYLDTGEHTSGFEVEGLYEAYVARELLENG